MFKMEKEVGSVDEQSNRAELLERLSKERPVPWDNLPDINLYMDQVVSYLPRQLIRFDEEEQLTSAMVNNYSKEGLLPRSEGKKYGRTHLAHLTAICALKQVLSVREIKALLSVTGGEGSGDAFYARFCAVLDTALTGAADKLAEESSGAEDLPLLALELALSSYANKLACQRILTLLHENEPKPERGKK
ncbi:MAG: DUF1836 domain-containing protein [Clostridia bacterium]|nr:DUF1836 domain-containing protein [Clostridia bacterium]